MTEITKNKPTSIAALFDDSIELIIKAEELAVLTNAEPPAKWVATHPYIKGYKYLPIDKVEYLLRRIFKRYRIEITGQGTAFNGVWVTVRVHYFSPVTNDFEYHDGIGAVQLQTAKGTSPADLANINQGALSMAFPIAKSVAVKDACDHLGRIFGADLNRKDVIPYQPDEDVLSKKQEILERRMKQLPKTTKP